MPKEPSPLFNGIINFSSYSDVENLSRFPDHAAIEKYRNERLSIYRPAANFLFRVAKKKRATVIEIGSGSSALLYALNEIGALEFGIGIEISPTRHQFAEKWKEDSACRNILNYHGDFLQFSFPEAVCEFFLVVNDTLVYIEPEGEAHFSALFRSANRALDVNGRLVIEVPNGTSDFYRTLKNELIVSYRRDLAASNAFASAHYEQTFDPKTNRIRNVSVYFSRDGGQVSKTDIAYLFTLDRLKEILAFYGFDVESIYGDLTGQEWSPRSSKSLVVVAKKRS
jgi:SAM-dependent methyltransferase